MEKLRFDDVKDETVIDLRDQLAFQAGHLDGALNLNPKNFNKYLSYFVDADEELVVVAEDVADLEGVIDQRVVGYLLAEDLPTGALVGVETISSEDFLGLEDDDYVLLDVRTSDEITRVAPKKNLLNIPFEELPERLYLFDASKKIYTLCGSGNRSTAAASYLLTMGLVAEVIEGGMKAVEAIGGYG